MTSTGEQLQALDEPTATNLADLYDLAPLAWGDVRGGLSSNFTNQSDTTGVRPRTFWLSTRDSDGRRHSLDLLILNHRSSVGPRPNALPNRRLGRGRSSARARAPSPTPDAHGQRQRLLSTLIVHPLSLDVGGRDSESLTSAALCHRP